MTRLEEEDFLFLNAEEEDVLETKDFMVVVEAIIIISSDAVQERTEKRGMRKTFRRQWWWIRWRWWWWKWWRVIHKDTNNIIREIKWLRGQKPRHQKWPTKRERVIKNQPFEKKDHLSLSRSVRSCILLRFVFSFVGYNPISDRGKLLFIHINQSIFILTIDAIKRALRREKQTQIKASLEIDVERCSTELKRAFNRTCCCCLNEIKAYLMWGEKRRVFSSYENWWKKGSLLCASSSLGMYLYERVFIVPTTFYTTFTPSSSFYLYAFSALCCCWCCVLLNERATRIWGKRGEFFPLHFTFTKTGEKKVVFPPPFLYECAYLPAERRR